MFFDLIYKENFPYTTRPSAMASQTMNQTNSNEVKCNEINSNEGKCNEGKCNEGKDKLFLKRFLLAISNETNQFPGPIRHWFRCEFDSNQTHFEKQKIAIRSRMSRVNASIVFYIFQSLWDKNESMICDFLNNYNSNYMVGLSDEEFYKKILERHAYMEKYEEEEDLEEELSKEFSDWCFFYSYFAFKDVQIASIETYPRSIEKTFSVWSLEDLISLVEKTPEFWLEDEAHIKEPFSFHLTLPMGENEMKKYFSKLKNEAKKEEKSTIRKLKSGDEKSKTKVKCGGSIAEEMDQRFPRIHANDTEKVKQ